MNFSFHFYGTFCAAVEAGFGKNDSWMIACAAQFVDDCSKTLLKKHGMSDRFPTYHANDELVDMNKGFFGTPFPKEIPKVWTSFHFLPGNYTADEHYRETFRNTEYIDNHTQVELFKLMCMRNSYMVGKIVDKAKEVYLSDSKTDNQKLCYIGIVMHVLADTFAHEYFVGTPSKAINECPWITEYTSPDEFSPSSVQECGKKHYTYAPAFSETSVGWLGHGRAGINPDIPNLKYFYAPNWNPNAKCDKNNPKLHLGAFVQMTDAMKFILDDLDNNSFDYKKELTETEYNTEYSKKIRAILTSDGDEKNQSIKWIQHIMDTYSRSTPKYDAEILASDNTFLTDFVNNADVHREMVCEYCRHVAPDLQYF